MNVQLLRKIKALILKEPRKMNMADWVIHIPKFVANLDADYKALKRSMTRTAPVCGTVGCIAGWAVILNQVSRATDKTLAKVGESITDDRGRYDSSYVVTEASALLGLTDIQAEHLFHTSSWPKPLQQRLHKYRPGTVKYAQVVADAIEHFIATDGWKNHQYDEFGYFVEFEGEEKEELAA